MRSFLNNPNIPRGIRNNNPGNLVKTNIAWQGKIPLNQNTDSRFEQFSYIHYGIRALMMDIINDMKKGSTTISLLISSYAPAFENNTTAYIKTVSASIGLEPDQAIKTLTKPLLISLCKAIVFVENGATPSKLLVDNDYQEAYNALGIDLKGIKLPLPKKKM